jgi:hypothetical protein
MFEKRITCQMTCQLMTLQLSIYHHHLHCPPADPSTASQPVRHRSPSRLRPRRKLLSRPVTLIVLILVNGWVIVELGRTSFLLHLIQF